MFKNRLFCFKPHILGRNGVIWIKGAQKIPLKLTTSFWDKRYHQCTFVHTQNTQKAAHLSIVDEIDWEDEDPDATVDEVEELDVDAHEGEDCHEQAKEDEDKEDAEEDAAAHCEINLGLKQFSFEF